MCTSNRFRLDLIETQPNASDMQERVLYYSFKYNIAFHLCACGCKEVVITPIIPGEWKLTYDGEFPTLHPSVGNYSFKCGSHYFIWEGKVDWAKSRTTKPDKKKKGLFKKLKRRNK